MKTRLAFCALAICLISTIATAQQVSVNYNHSQSFAQFHTYAWGGSNANQVQNSILAQVAVQEYEYSATGQGVENGAGEPESRLDRHREWRAEARDILHCLGHARDRWRNGGITPEQNVKGTLIVDLYDAKGQSLLWRGIAESTLDKNDNKNQQLVQKAIQKMFKQWPS